MAGPNIEPRPYDLAKMHNFYKCTNDVIRPLYYLQWVQIWKNLLRVSIPGAPIFFDLGEWLFLKILHFSLQFVAFLKTLLTFSAKNICATPLATKHWLWLKTICSQLCKILAKLKSDQNKTWFCQPLFQASDRF